MKIIVILFSIIFSTIVFSDDVTSLDIFKVDRTSDGGLFLYINESSPPGEEPSHEYRLSDDDGLASTYLAFRQLRTDLFVSNTEVGKIRKKHGDKEKAWDEQKKTNIDPKKWNAFKMIFAEMAQRNYDYVNSSQKADSQMKEQANRYKQMIDQYSSRETITWGEFNRIGIYLEGNLDRIYRYSKTDLFRKKLGYPKPIEIKTTTMNIFFEPNGSISLPVIRNTRSGTTYNGDVISSFKNTGSKETGENRNDGNSKQI